MKSRPINEFQHTHVSMKSAREAQAEAREANAKPMSALPLFVNGKRKSEGDPIAILIHFATGL